VLVRIIECYDQTLIDSVIRYNNTQNPIKAWELRVIDPIQSRIKSDFETLKINYQLRRGSARRRSSDVLYEKLGPILSAFYGDPMASHKNRNELYETESKYRKLFDDNTNVRNLYFIYCLEYAVARKQNDLRNNVIKGTPTEDQKSMHQYFRYAVFKYVLIYVCSNVIGLWVKATDDFNKKISLHDKILFDQEKREGILYKIIDVVLLAMNSYLKGKDVYGKIKTHPGVKEISDNVKALVEQVDKMMPETYKEFTNNLVLLK